MDSFEAAFAAAADALETLRGDASLKSGIADAARRAGDCLLSGGKILACGNGGSLADAMHLCEELTGRFRKDRRAYPALCLSDPTHLTCVGNDFGFEEVFRRGVEAFGKPGDLLFALSTSGNSENIVRALTEARNARVFSVGLLGGDGGRCAPLCDLPLVFPGNGSDRIQELHMLALHALIEAVEAHLGHA